jgi:hypothetical protein
MIRASAAALVALAACSCAAAAPAAPPGPTLAEWRAARSRLAGIRRLSEGTGQRTLRIAMKLREPYTGQTFDARGALAIKPPHALRMILLGPGGTTALDLWVSGDRFRFAIPAIDLLRRGDAATPRASMRGLPVDFLRWWLLRPASGKLLWHLSEPDADRFFLRDGSSLVDLRLTARGELVARRTTWTLDPPDAPIGHAPPSPRSIGEELVTASGIGCVPVRYTQVSTGLEVAIRCEGEADRPPDPRAFLDPDAPEPSMQTEPSSQGGSP